MDPESILAQASAKLPEGCRLNRNACLKRIHALQAVQTSDASLLVAFLDEVSQNPTTYFEKSTNSQAGAAEVKSAAPQRVGRDHLMRMGQPVPEVKSSTPRTVEQDARMPIERGQRAPELKSSAPQTVKQDAAMPRKRGQQMPQLCLEQTADLARLRAQRADSNTYQPIELRVKDQPSPKSGIGAFIRKLFGSGRK